MHHDGSAFDKLEVDGALAMERQASGEALKLSSKVLRLIPNRNRSQTFSGSASSSDLPALDTDTPRSTSRQGRSLSFIGRLASRTQSDDGGGSRHGSIHGSIHGSVNGSGHGRNAAYQALADALPAHSGEPSLSESRSHTALGSLVSLASDAVHRRASTTWDFRHYPIDPEEYELLEIVGQGATATVYLAYCPAQDVDVAIKIVDLDEPSINLPAIVAEVHTMKQLKHPNILPLYAAFLDGDQLWMVMPFVAGGSAYDVMRRCNANGLNEHVIATIMRDVLQALAYMHKDGYIHRDLKAGNILIDHRGQVILADMGVTAAMARSHRLHTSESPVEGLSAYLSRKTFAGTPCWMAPEVMEDHSEYNCSADIWSFGITLLELALGQAPLANFNLDQILMKTLNEPPPVLESSDRRKRFTEDLQDLVTKCLQKDPADRTPATKLLKHRFFKAAYDGAYLTKQLDIGTGVALAGNHGGKSAVSLVQSGITGIVRQVTDKARPTGEEVDAEGAFKLARRPMLLLTARLTGEEVDAQDAFKLVRRLTLPPQWLPEDSEPLPIASIRTAKGIAFGMLKSTGTGVKFLRGSGFVLGRSVNSRRETRWSAPSYFRIDIRGLPPHMRNMGQVHMCVVLSSQEALDRLKEPQCDFEPTDDDFEEDEFVPGSSPPKHRTKLKALGKHLFGAGGTGGLAKRVSSASSLAGRANSHASSGIHSRQPSSTGSGGCRTGPAELPTIGHALQPDLERPAPFAIPLQGVTLSVDTRQNALLYGEDATPWTILDIRKTRRPAPFDRLCKDLEQMTEGAQAGLERRPEEAQWFKSVYHFQ